MTKTLFRSLALALAALLALVPALVEKINAPD